METDPAGHRPHSITQPIRYGLCALGTASWFSGGAACFVSENGAGAAALVAAGLSANVLGFIGTWPTKLTLSGNEIAWDHLRKGVANTLESAEESAPASTVEDLRILLRQVDSARTGGTVTMHPAEAYDLEVSRAIRLTFPGCTLIRQTEFDHQRPDFVLRLPDGEILIETKWRADPSQPFGGSTLNRLVAHIPEGAKLLVIANARDVTRARNRIENLLPDRSAVVTWQGPHDNDALMSAINQLIRRAA